MLLPRLFGQPALVSHYFLEEVDVQERRLHSSLRQVVVVLQHRRIEVLTVLAKSFYLLLCDRHLLILLLLVTDLNFELFP